ncbi:GAF domain-containing protein [Salinicoccus roseus]|uniref:GAF domain-containing protein n=1 Tax=Salinicoccus roseus TaxID=45670 RepID=UPI0023014839|nr:GAF domain-containing protein [Salinicoccus roseus]
MMVEKTGSVLMDMKETFDFDIVALTDVKNRRGQYMVKWKYNVGSTNPRWRKIALPTGRGVPGAVMKSGKTMVVQDISETEIATSLFRYPILRMEHLKSFIAFPIWNDDEEVIGILMMGNRRERAFTDTEYRTIKQYVETTLRQQILKELMVNE